MIDFRYHVVSIVAVFLALAIGIVLGSTELQGKAIDALRGTSNQLTNELAQTRAQRDNFAAQAAEGEQFAQAAEPVLLNKLLTGRKIVLIAEPGADSGVVNGVKQAATAAGAQLTGLINLQPAFNDTSMTTQSTLESLIRNIGAGGQSGTAAGNPSAIEQQQAAQAFASAIMQRSPDVAPASTPDQAKAMLTAYSQAGFLNISGTPYQPATLAVVITPQSPPSHGNADTANQVLVAVTQAFAGAGAAAVVAGNTTGSGSGSGISALRSSDVAAKVSTIDDADTTAGQTTVMLALASQLAGGKAGSYGVVGASNGVSPNPVPTATPSATATHPTDNSNKRKGKK